MNPLQILQINWRLYSHKVFDFLSAILFWLIPFYFVRLESYHACNTSGLTIQHVIRLLNSEHLHQLRQTKDTYVVCFGWQLKLFSFSSFKNGNIFQDVKVRLRHANKIYRLSRYRFL